MHNSIYILKIKIYLLNSKLVIILKNSKINSKLMKYFKIIFELI